VKVTLDRSGGKKLGVRLGSAAGPGEPLPINSVEATGQAHGKLLAGDTVIAINGNVVLGMTMKEAAKYVLSSDLVELTLGARGEPRRPSIKSIANLTAAPTPVATDSDGAVKVTLDRSGGKKVGVRLGNAAGPGEPLPIVSVEATGQAHGKLVPGDTVLAINGNVVLGMTMKEAAKYVLASDLVELTLGARGLQP
jgi:C-terminal processing protease CtpA/Prc